MSRSRLFFCSLLAAFAFLALLCSPAAEAQQRASASDTRVRVPDSYAHIAYDETQGRLYFKAPGKKRLWVDTSAARYTLDGMQGRPEGTETGIRLTFPDADGLDGLVYYGLVPFDDSRYPQPLFRGVARIKNGAALLHVAGRLSGKYDATGWEETGRGVLGYRVQNASGLLLYEGRVAFAGTGPFRVAPTIVEGPSVNNLTDEGATISFVTRTPQPARVKVEGCTFRSDSSEPVRRHELTVRGLAPGTRYEYAVVAGEGAQAAWQRFPFHTAPRPGSQEAFTFAYASDARASPGGGERNLYGPNFYMMKRIAALATRRDATFMQFTGDLVSGYLRHPGAMDLQYANWKRAVGPFAHQLPIYTTMGNHETIVHDFRGKDARFRVDRFPFGTQSAEAVFARNFVNPVASGLESEDGADYDPDPDAQDFPSYRENVYSYTYGNVAMVVLNSNYWYAPSLPSEAPLSGNLHGYIMDRQLAWFRSKLQALEKNPNIDHVFVTAHTPLFPNGGHTGNDMWHNGSNAPRAVVAGEPVEQGIIERRDELLDAMANESSKVVAVLTGDEHNYNRLRITDDMPRYPDGYEGSRLKLHRAIWQITNGAGGAPYYAQQKAPWSDRAKGFTPQNALVLFHVEGERVEMEVRNPDTLEPIDEAVLRKGTE